MPRADSQPVALAADFPAADPAEWARRAAAVLQQSGAPDGTDPMEALSHTTYDGIQVRPLYTQDDALHAPAPGRPPFSRAATAGGTDAAGWDVRARLADPDVDRVVAAARTELAQGATSLWLVLGAGGVPLAALARALDGIDLARAHLVLDAGPDSGEAADLLLRIAAGRGLPADQLAGGLGLDPIGARARTGSEADLAHLPELTRAIADHPRLLPITVDATGYHGAGAGDADEIAIATAVGVAYLRTLADAGQEVGEALSQMEFRFAVTADQFLSIAKLRAARRVWDRVAELSGAAPDRRGQRQHAVTSAAMMTRRDPWVNMLRTAIACFAAAVGGAEAVTVLPFDSAIGVPDEFGRRIARNTNWVLHDEASLGRVIDPAGGSWYVEQLSEALAERAWDGFKDLERAGGALAALDDGVIAERIGHARRLRDDDIARRRAPLTGISEYALLTEAPVVRPPAPTPASGPLVLRRYAEPYERLRDRADAALEQRGRRPTVLLLTLGAGPAASARVRFAASLFRAGGIQSVVTQGLPDDLADLAVVCLCGADEEYEQSAAATAQAAKRAGAKWVWLAGPQALQDIDGNLSAGCDVLAVLSRTMDLLDVS